MDQNVKFIISLIGKINYKVQKYLVRELKAKNIKGISPSHGDILGAIFVSKELQMKELAEIINKDKSTVTALVNKLIRLGHVEQIPDPDDSRARRVRLAKKGEALKPAVLDIGKKMRAKAYKGMSKDEQETLLKLLAKLYDNM